MSGGVWHPDGCRCSGCIPAQVVIRQEYPSPGSPKTPQQRPRKPPPRKQSAGDYGIIGPAFLIFLVVAVVGFWPVMVWHGYTDTGGWRWDIHSTVAEATYLGVIGFIGLMCWAGNRVPTLPDRPAREVPPPPAPAPPICLHRNAVKVNSSVPGLDLTYSCWCPSCETALPANFRYPCCGGEPGTLPGDGHAYNCPQVKR